MRQWTAALALAGMMAMPGPVAADDASHLCSAAADRAARETGVPRALLRAVMTAESGRGDLGGGLRPWPWALNVEGQGHWPATEDAALAMVDGFLREGRNSIDIGCFQINLRWHGRAFNSAAEMIDPDRNAAYAAEFLLDLYRETGSWREAAGAYHSRDPARAEAYVARLKSVHAALAAAGPAVEGALPREPSRADATPVAFSLRGSRGPIIAARSARGPLLGRGAAP